ncbi:hypothetical protein PFFCH_01554 [Plasmodium falciparum FCH/4]|uniref:Uncharacterized protein n=1 Tax=Plasmodium falciparum FCH/4 TaxID=1036724 RepID=A0A024VS32_PLAFA|nr:hypothetical protein PFFCH_01554 [Plasmodium falciparum FCH/4]
MTLENYGSSFFSEPREEKKKKKERKYKISVILNGCYIFRLEYSLIQRNVIRKKKLFKHNILKKL